MFTKLRAVKALEIKNAYQKRLFKVPKKCLSIFFVHSIYVQSSRVSVHLSVSGRHKYQSYLQFKVSIYFDMRSERGKGVAKIYKKVLVCQCSSVCV